MMRKRKNGEVVAYLLAMVAGALLLPVIATVMIWTNASGYPDEDSSTLGIQFGSGVVSILIVFANLVVSAAPVRGIKFFRFDGRTVLYSPPAGADGGEQTAETETNTGPTEVPPFLPVEEENEDTEPNNET